MSEYIEIPTGTAKQVIDITDKINSKLTGTGLCNLFVLHTSAGIACVDMDPGADLDFLDALDKIAPKLKYRHPHDPSHFPDHVLSTIVGVSLTLPVDDGNLVLGEWQRVVLMEFNGPRKREIILTFIKN